MLQLAIQSISKLTVSTMSSFVSTFSTMAWLLHACDLECCNWYEKTATCSFPSSHERCWVNSLLMSLLLKLGVRGSMLCCRVEWEQALDHHDITAEVRSTSSGQLLMKGLMAKVMTCSVQLQVGAMRSAALLKLQCVLLCSLLGMYDR